MRRRFLALLRLLWLAGALGSAQTVSAQTVSGQTDIRVLLGEAPSVTVSMAGAHRGALEDGRSFETAFGLDWPLRAEGDLLVLDGAPIGRSLTLEPREGFVTWAGEQYRGKVRLVAASDWVLVLNVLDLEDYLRGVVPAEMAALWPLEAQRDQPGLSPAPASPR